MTTEANPESSKSHRRPARGPRFGVAQLAPALGDLERNLELHIEAVEAARADGVEVLVFPELSLTGYRLKDMVPEVAAERDGPVFEALAELSKGMSLVVGLVEETAQHFFYNSAVYFEDGKVLDCKRKVYLPTYGMFDEQRYFARGNRIAAFDTAHGRVAILICEEMLHPSAVTIAALDGASTLIVPAASPARGALRPAEGDVGADPDKSAEVDANGRHWESYNRVMARSLGLHVVYANRAGVEDGHTYWGGSEIVGPSGETLAKAAYYDSDVIAAVLPEDSIRRRRIQAPVLRDEDVDLTINELSRIRGRRVPAASSHGDQPPVARGGPRDAQGGSFRDGPGGSRYEGDRGRGGRDDRSHGGGGSRERRDEGGWRGGRDDRSSGGGGRERRETGGWRGGRDDRSSGGGGRERRDEGGWRGGRDDRSSGGGGRERREEGGWRGGRRDDRSPGGGGRERREEGGRRGGRDDRSYAGGGGRERRDDRPFGNRGPDRRNDDSRQGGARGRDDYRSGDSGEHEPPSRMRPEAGERKPRPVDIDGAVTGSDEAASAETGARAGGKKG